MMESKTNTSSTYNLGESSIIFFDVSIGKN